MSEEIGVDLYEWCYWDWEPIDGELPPKPPRCLNYVRYTPRGYHCHAELIANHKLKFHPADINGDWRDWFLWDQERLEQAGYEYVHGTYREHAKT